jgi:glutathione S-transferase
MKQESIMELVVIVIMLALVEYIVLGARVGFARGRTGLEAPAVTGNEEFERHFRVHYNTIEQLILFIPGIWFFAEYVHVLGAVPA